MKYIISKSRLDGVVDAYLDSLDFKTVKIKFPAVRRKTILLIVNNVVSGKITQHNDLWIDELVISTFMGLFSLSKEDAIKQIKRYLFKRQKIKFDSLIVNMRDSHIFSDYQYWYEISKK